MANKYYKNFILCGEIDYHCLLCHENFQFLADVDKHIRWETHRKTVKSQTRHPKFKHDPIYKISAMMFYCEACNCIGPDIKAALAHIVKKEHQANKEKPKTEEVTSKICQRDSGYIIVSDAIVENRDWHGILDNTCVICDEEINNPVKHINTTEHVVNLIQTPVIRKDKDKVYRELNKNAFFCFTCKDIKPLSSFESHWTDMQHEEKKKAGIFVTTVSTTASVVVDKRLELEKKIIELQKEYYTINTEKGEAICKECKVTVQIDCKILLSHQKCHREARQSQPVIVVEAPSSSDEDIDEVVYQEVQDHGKRRNEMSKYGKENYIKLNPGGSKGYCSLCHVGMSGCLKVFKEHVRGSCHKGHLELIGVRAARDHSVPTSKSKPLADFLQNIFYSRQVKVVWLNKHICLDIQSFILVSDMEKNPHKQLTKCYACDVYYKQGGDLEHYESTEHKKRFLNAKVILVTGEFVREVRPDLFHCGFCNQIYPYWELMQKHLGGWRHKQKKNSKDLVWRITDQWFDERMLTITSHNPDILYLQFISLGIFCC